MVKLSIFIVISLLAAILAVGMFAILKVTERNVLVTEIKLNKATGLLNKIKIKYVIWPTRFDYRNILNMVLRAHMSLKTNINYMRK